MSASSAAALAYLQGAEVVYALEDQETQIGRADSNDIVLTQSRSISSVHARIVIDPSTAPAHAVLHDLKSLNGCFINETRVQNASAPLHSGDVIKFGYDVNTFKFWLPEDVPPYMLGDSPPAAHSTTQSAPAAAPAPMAASNMDASRGASTAVSRVRSPSVSASPVGGTARARRMSDAKQREMSGAGAATALMHSERGELSMRRSLTRSQSPGEARTRVDPHSLPAAGVTSSSLAHARAHTLMREYPSAPPSRAKSGSHMRRLSSTSTSNSPARSTSAPPGTRRGTGQEQQPPWKQRGYTKYTDAPVSVAYPRAGDGGGAFEDSLNDMDAQARRSVHHRDSSGMREPATGAYDASAVDAHGVDISSPPPASHSSDARTLMSPTAQSSVGRSETGRVEADRLEDVPEERDDDHDASAPRAATRRLSGGLEHGATFASVEAFHTHMDTQAPSRGRARYPPTHEPPYTHITAIGPVTVHTSSRGRNAAQPGSRGSSGDGDSGDAADERMVHTRLRGRARAQPPEERRDSEGVDDGGSVQSREDPPVRRSRAPAPTPQLAPEVARDLASLQTLTQRLTHTLATSSTTPAQPAVRVPRLHRAGALLLHSIVQRLDTRALARAVRTWAHKIRMQEQATQEATPVPRSAAVDRPAVAAAAESTAARPLAASMFTRSRPHSAPSSPASVPAMAASGVERTPSRSRTRASSPLPTASPSRPSSTAATMTAVAPTVDASEHVHMHGHERCMSPPRPSWEPLNMRASTASSRAKTRDLRTSADVSPKPLAASRLTTPPPPARTAHDPHARLATLPRPPLQPAAAPAPPSAAPAPAPAPVPMPVYAPPAAAAAASYPYAGAHNRALQAILRTREEAMKRLISAADEQIITLAQEAYDAQAQPHPPVQMDPAPVPEQVVSLPPLPRAWQPPVLEPPPQPMRVLPSIDFSTPLRAPAEYPRPVATPLAPPPLAPPPPLSRASRLMQDAAAEEMHASAHARTHALFPLPMGMEPLPSRSVRLQPLTHQPPRYKPAGLQPHTPGRALLLINEIAARRM